MDLVWVWFELVFLVEEEEAAATKSSNDGWKRGFGGERGEGWEDWCGLVWDKREVRSASYL